MLLSHIESLVPENISREAIGQGGNLLTEVEFDSLRFSSYICLHFR